MKRIKGYFYLNTGYVNGQKREEFDFVVDENLPEATLRELLLDGFNDFLNTLDTGWIIESIE
jgi:hypothetical protein